MTIVREANFEDLGAMTGIYNHYIRNSHATFRADALTIEQRKPWFESYTCSQRHLLLVLQIEGAIGGYAGAGPYRHEPGFEHTVEMCAYLAPNLTGQGYGRLLYGQVFEKLESRGFHRALAGIALPNVASVALHKAFGFEEIGTFTEYATKWGKYWSSLWMEKVL